MDPDLTDEGTFLSESWISEDETDEGTFELSHVRPALYWGGPVWHVDEDAYAALAPQQTPPPRLEVTAVTDEVTTTYDLGIRRRRLNRTDGTVTVFLADDAALMETYAPVEEEDGLLGSAMIGLGLNWIVGAVIAEAVPGATFVDSIEDPDVTPFWEVTNRFRNPRMQTTAGYTLGFLSTNLTTGSTSPAIGTDYIRWEATGAGNAAVRAPLDGGCAGGDVFTAWVNMRASSAALDGRILVRFLNGDGDTVKDVYSPAEGILDSPGWSQLFTTVTAPPGAVQFEVWFIGVATAGGQTFAASGGMCYEGRYPVLIDFFSGSSSSPDYTFSWADAANASASTRVPIVERDPESLIWKAGQSAMAFLTPLVQAAGYRLVCDQHRVFSLRGDSWWLPDGFEELPALEVGVNAVELEREDSREEGYYDAAVRRYVWRDRRGRDREKDDTYVDGASPTSTDFRVINAPYPGPGRAQAVVQRSMLRGGQTFKVAARADWQRLPDTPAVINTGDDPVLTRIQAVAYDIASNTMTITAAPPTLTE